MLVQVGGCDMGFLVQNIQWGCPWEEPCGKKREEAGGVEGRVKLWCSPMADLANPMGALPHKASVRAARPVPALCLYTPTAITHGMWAAWKRMWPWMRQLCNWGRPERAALGLVALPQHREWAATSLSLKGDLGSGLSPPSQMLIFTICQKLHPFTAIYTYDGKF